MSDFTISVDFDARQILQGFSKLEQDARSSGESVGKKLAEGIQGSASKSFGQLQQEIRALKSAQLKLPVDSSQYAEAQNKIKQLGALISELQRKKTTVGVDDRSIDALRTKLQELQRKQTKVSVDSKEFVDLQRQIDAVEKELQDIERKRVKIDVDANSITAITSRLQAELQRLEQRRLKVNVDSQEFRDLGREIDRVQGELAAVERKRTQVNVDDRSIQTLQNRLSDLQARQTKVSVDSKEFAVLQREIDKTQRELEAVERKKITVNVDSNSVIALTTNLNAELDRLQRRQLRVNIDSREFKALQQQINGVQDQIAAVERKRLLVTVDGKSITALQAQLRDLEAKQAKVSVDSTEFARLGREIDGVKGKISEVERKKLLISADSNSITALNVKLQGLREEINKVEIGGKRFKELSTEIQKTERELNRANTAAGGFRASIGNMAASLAAIGVSAAGVTTAIFGLVQGAAAFDNEVRKAAAIEGKGQYDQLRASIEGVARVAAGTPRQVAELATALSRAGFSADETKQSLRGIVQGAEATGVSFETMGSIASNVLRGFGMEASQTQDVVDTLTNTVNSSNQGIEDLGEALKYAVPIARNLGISMDDLSGTMALFADNGIKGSMAGTGFASSMTRIQLAASGSAGELQELTRGNSILTKAMKSLGAEVLDTSGKLKPMDQVLIAIKRSMQNLSVGQQAELAKALFGDENARKFLALLNTSDDKIKATFQNINNSGGVAARTQQQMQGFAYSIEVLKGNLEILTNAIGQGFTTVLGPLVNGLNQAISWTQSWPEPIKAVGSALAALGLTAAAVGLTVAGFAITLQTLQATGVIASITKISTALKAQLASAVSAAAAAWPALLAAVKSFTVANAISSIQALAASLKVTFIAGVAAAKQAVISFVLYLQSVSFASLLGSIGSVIATLGPLVLAIAAVGAAIYVWQKLTGDASQVQKDFAGLHERSAESTKKLEAAIGSLGNQTSKSSGQMMTMIEVLASWKAINQLVIEVNNLTAGMDAGFNAALKFIGELRNGGPVTEDARAKAKAFTDALNEQIAVLKQSLVAARDRLAALEAGGRGQTKEAEALRSSINGMEAEIRARENAKEAILRQTVAQAEASGKKVEDLNLTKEQIKFNQDRAKTEEELNKILREAPVRRLDRELAVGQQLLSLSKGIGDVEQSRYAVTSSALNFQLKKAEEQGASEQQLKSLKEQIAANDRAALEARYRALVQQQQLERTMLALTQEKARIEADLAVIEQRANILKSEAEVQKAIADIANAKNEEERLAARSAKAAAEAQVGLQREILGVREGAVGLLQRTQPLERAALGFQQEAARNGLQAQAAANGYRIAVDGSLVPVRSLAELQGRVSVAGKLSADEQQRYERIAAAGGIAIGKAADGTVILGQTQEDVNNEVFETNKRLFEMRTRYDNAASAAEGTAGKTGGIGDALQGTRTPFDNLIRAFGASGDTANRTIVASANQFGIELNRAGGEVDKINKLRLDKTMMDVRDRTREAAGQAERYYNALRNASNIQKGVWTGGPVEGGVEYRINELGQEAFLSAGRLSLINAPANSIWRAPSDGVVIPAGITAQLQARAAVEATGGGQVGVAELAVEVGKLRAEVGNLARRDWSVNITQRTGPTGSQVMRTLLS